MLFGVGTDQGDLGILTSRPLTSFTKAGTVLRKHSEKESHRSATTRAAQFLRVMTGEQKSVTQQIDKALVDRITANRLKLASILKIIILCGRQTLALRSRNDTLQDVHSDPDRLSNHGNFWALVDFRVDAGDKILEAHLQSAPNNATYTSSVIQNQLIHILGDYIRNIIIDGVIKSPLFSVIADEVTDVANFEQLSLVLRYVDSDGCIHEDLVDFIECDEGVTGQAIADKILGKLETYGLDC